jgi:hypothetical protein
MNSSSSNAAPNRRGQTLAPTGPFRSLYEFATREVNTARKAGDDGRTEKPTRLITDVHDVHPFTARFCGEQVTVQTVGWHRDHPVVGTDEYGWLPAKAVITNEATNRVQAALSTDGATINQIINGEATNCIQSGDVYGDINF